MKDSQDWLDTLFIGKAEVLFVDTRHDTRGKVVMALSAEQRELYKSEIREHFLKEALELINGVPKLILKGKFEDDMGLFGDYVEIAELRNKFNDKYKED